MPEYMAQDLNGQNPSSKKIHQVSEMSNRAIGIINSGTNRNFPKKMIKSIADNQDDNASVSSISKIWKGMNCQGTNNMQMI
jgi:hypothetical protein